MNIQEVKDKRRNEFLENLADINLDNPLVASAVIHATQIAERNHDDNFLDALFNAVCNVGSGDDELAITFMNWMGIFTPKHIEMLRVTANPPERPFNNKLGIQDPYSQHQKMMGSRKADVEHAVWRELHSRGLVVRPQYRDEFQEDITPLGKAFLAFLSDPDFE